jgi:hypothetical protein
LSFSSFKALSVYYLSEVLGGLNNEEIEDYGAIS